MRPHRPLLALAAFLTCGVAFAAADEAGAPVAVGFGDLPVELSITDLKRTDEGATVMLRGILKNPSTQDVDLGHASEMSLTDFRNRRKYMVITDSSLACSCSPSGAVEVPASGSLHVWAKFPAPPEGVTTMSFGWGHAEPVSVQIVK